MLPAVLEIFASLVEYKNDFKFTKFDHKVYKALPSYFVHIANGSRPDSGFRLLRRCTRHSMDTQVHNIQETRGTLFQNESGTIGMSMNNLVPDSMKQNKYYDVSVAFSSDELMTCQCDCKRGGEGDQKIVCVHILPIIFQLSLLLVEGLAENILLELSARFKDHNEEALGLLPEGEMKIERMKKSINILMLAAGETPV